MIRIKYENAAKEITLEDAIKCYENGIAMAINDGKDITIEIEKVGDAKCLE